MSTCDHTIKLQENGEYRCSWCWARFVEAIELSVQIADEQKPVMPLEDNLRKDWGYVET